MPENLTSAAQRAELMNLAWHWDGAYHFDVADGVWQATYCDDPGVVLTADTPGELREKIHADYPGRRRTVTVGADAQERMST
jgi:hypothetical protein